jgi:hypothetical protein
MSKFIVAKFKDLEEKIIPFFWDIPVTRNQKIRLCWLL